MSQVFYGVWLSEGYAIGVDDIVFNDNFKEAYKSVFDMYLKFRTSQKKEDEKALNLKLVDLLKKYGGEL